MVIVALVRARSWTWTFEPTSAGLFKDGDYGASKTATRPSRKAGSEALGWHNSGRRGSTPVRSPDRARVVHFVTHRRPRHSSRSGDAPDYSRDSDGG